MTVRREMMAQRDKREEAQLANDMSAIPTRRAFPASLARPA